MYPSGPSWHHSRRGWDVVDGAVDFVWILFHLFLIRRQWRRQQWSGVYLSGFRYWFTILLERWSSILLFICAWFCFHVGVLELLLLDVLVGLLRTFDSCLLSLSQSHLIKLICLRLDGFSLAIKRLDLLFIHFDLMEQLFLAQNHLLIDQATLLIILILARDSHRSQIRYRRRALLDQIDIILALCSQDRGLLPVDIDSIKIECDPNLPILLLRVALSTAGRYDRLLLWFIRIVDVRKQFLVRGDIPNIWWLLQVGGASIVQMVLGDDVLVLHAVVSEYHLLQLFVLFYV